MSDLLRDKETNKIISYMGSKFADNVGTVDVLVADERFITSNFRYIVKTAFNSLPDAIQAESNVLKMAKKYEDAFIKGVPLSELTNEDITYIKETAKAQLLSDLNNLIEGNENSIAALQQKISDLQNTITDKNKLINDWNNQKTNWDAREELYTADLMRASMRIDELERLNASIVQGQEESIEQVRKNLERQDGYVSSSMSNLELKIVSQLEDIKDQLVKGENIGNIDDLLLKLEKDYSNPRIQEEIRLRNSLRVGTAGEFKELNRLATSGTGGTGGVG